MHSLEGIITANRRAAVKVEDNFARHCSFQGDAEMGVVLHSAKLRNTVFLPGAAKGRQSPAARFLRATTVCNPAALDEFIESFFE